MTDDAPITLLCGECPCRRILCRLAYFPYLQLYRVPGPKVLPYAHNRRRTRHPSVDASPPIGLVAIGEPLRRRCRLGHAWTLPQPELIEAILAARKAGRQDLVAGVDVARRRR